MTLRAAIYARVSTDRQREKQTIASQLRLLPEYAKSQGWSITDQYVDDGRSGETVEDRPEFRRLLDDAAIGAFDILLVIDLDRITRSKKSTEGAFVYDYLRENKIKIATTSQGIIDLDDEDQDFLVGIKRELAKWEKRKIIARMMRGKREAARQGSRRYGCIDPYGYAWIPAGDDPRRGGYQVNEPEAKVVREIFRLAVDDGLGISMIAFRLNEEGHRTRALKRRGRYGQVSGRWATSSIGKILHSRTYLGEFRVFRRSDEIIIRVPPIVDPEIWNAAQVAVQGRRPEQKWSHERQYLLSGIAVCGICNAAMWIVNPRPGTHHRYAYYRCSSTNSWRRMNLPGPCGNKHHRVDRVDALVWHKVVEVLSDPGLLTEAVELSQKENEAGVDWASQKQASERKLKELTRLVGETNNRRRRGMLTAEDTDKELTEIAKERKILLRNVEVAARQLKSTGAKTLGIETAKDQVAQLLRDLKEATFEEKRSLVRALFPREHGCSVVLLKSGDIEAKGILKLEEGADVPVTMVVADGCTIR